MGSQFKRGRTSSEDEARSGRPVDATDEEMSKNGIWYTLMGEFRWKKRGRY